MFGYGAVALDDLIWLTDRPDRLARGSVADMSAQDHLVVHARRGAFFQQQIMVTAQVSVIVPSTLEGAVAKNPHQFAHVLSEDVDFAAGLPNGATLDGNGPLAEQVARCLGVIS